MKRGYIAELHFREKEFQNAKSHLEDLFMKKENEEQIQQDPTLKSQYEAAISSVEKHVFDYAGTVRSVKLAVET